MSAATGEGMDDLLAAIQVPPLPRFHPGSPAPALFRPAQGPLRRAACPMPGADARLFRVPVAQDARQEYVREFLPQLEQRKKEFEEKEAAKREVRRRRRRRSHGAAGSG